MKNFSKIIQSKNDKRIYKNTILKNNLSCLLISDKETVKSAASITVKVGYYLDPPNRSGLAHFLEHLLFLGSEKFPQYNEYNDFIRKNSGSCNAYTSSIFMKKLKF